jgi:hypothetical protein
MKPQETQPHETETIVEFRAFLQIVDINDGYLALAAYGEYSI